MGYLYIKFLKADISKFRVFRRARSRPNVAASAARARPRETCRARAAEKVL